MTHPRIQRILPAETFKTSFAAIKPLILSEWTQLQPENLDAAEGDLDLIVEHIASQTESTRTLIRYQLAELYHIAISEYAASTHPESQPKPAVETETSHLKDVILPSLEKSFRHLEQRAEKLLGQMDQEILPQLDEQLKKTLPELNDRLKERPGTSLLTVFGIGFLVGMIFGGFGRGR